jgi:hypothetical protein
VYDILTLVLLVMLMCCVFYAGYQFAIPRVTEKVLDVLREDHIIRLVEQEDGEIEVYSGYKFYQDKVK